MLKYKCLILDHDDTTVQSSIAIHYPAFQKVLKKYEPSLFYSFDEYRSICFEIGIREYYRQTLKFNQAQLDDSEATWKSYVEQTIPKAFDGLSSVLDDYRKAGGLIAVNSHSHTSFIQRDFQHLFGFQPDLIVGYDSDSQWVKPNTGMIDYLMDTYQLLPQEILMVDDLTPGQNMANNAGIDFAAAGYGITVENMKSHFKNTATYYLDHAEDLYELLF